MGTDIWSSCSWLCWTLNLERDCDNAVPCHVKALAGVHSIIRDRYRCEGQRSLVPSLISGVPALQRVCDWSLAGADASNAAGGTDVLSLVIVVCCHVEALQRADPSSRGFLPTMVCLTECDQETLNLSNYAPWRASPSFGVPSDFPYSRYHHFIPSILSFTLVLVHEVPFRPHEKFRRSTVKMQGSPKQESLYTTNYGYYAP